jgi:hypothetical protein
MNPDEKPCELRITFQDEYASTEALLVTPVGQNLYRAEERSILGEVSYHDIIETELLGDGTVRFLRVVTPSELKTESWIISQACAESPRLSTLLDRVMAVGGNWERIFGGFLIVHLPPAEYDVLIPEFNSLLETFNTDTPR